MRAGWTRGRSRTRGWAGLAFVLALLPLSTNVDALTFLQVFSTDHPHALMTVIDGGHVDLILAHDAARPVGEEDPSLNPKSAEDHVIHISKDELAAAQKRIASSLPAATAAPIVSVAALAPASRAPAFVPCRTATPFSRRSVVLRT